MECIQPGAIRDEELLAYLAEETVRPAVSQHVARCPHCSSQVADYRRLELMLTKKLYRWDCPSTQVLGEYQLELLSNDLRAEVKRHLRMCVLCTAELTTLTEFLAHDPLLVERAPVAQEQLPTPAWQNNSSDAGVKRSLDGLRERAWEGMREGVRRIVAVLQTPEPRLAYQRDAAQQTSLWPRRYAAEDVSISLQLEAGSARRSSVQLIGFVTRQGTALETLQGTPVHLLSSPKATYTQTIDELGNFLFSSVAPDTYTLEIQFPENTIVIEQIAVTSQW